MNRNERDLDKEIEELEQEMFGTQEVEEENEEESTLEEESTEQEEEQEVVPVQEETIPQQQPEVDWEKRFKNYKASTDITIRDLRSDLAKFKSKLADLQVEYSALVQTSKETQGSKSIFTEDDIDILGEPAVNAINKGVAEMVNSRVKPLQDEINRSRKELAEREASEAKALAKTNYNQFLSKLAKVVPDYEDINVSPGFIEYMKEVDEYSDYPRSYLFEKAEQALDVQRISSFFLDYKSKVSGKKKPLEKAITPSGVRGDSQNTRQNNSGKDINITRAFIDQFYNDLNRGKYKGEKAQKEANRIEALIDQAVISGQVR